MTRGDAIRQWDIFQLAKWFTLIERKAVENAEKLKNMSDEDLIADWLSFLDEEA